MARKDTILISLRFGSQKWEHIPFLSAVDTVERFLKAEQDAYVGVVTQLNEDHWLTSYYAGLLGGAQGPAEEDWSAPRLALGRARNFYVAGRDTLAMHALRDGVGGFNAVHKTFYDYRDALAVGAERAITTLEITMMVAGAAFSAGVGVAGASFWGGVMASTGLTLGEQLASNASKKYLVGLETEFDVGEIVLQTAASFVSNLISGALTEKFAALLAERYIAQVLGVYNRFLPAAERMTFQQIVKWAAENGVALPVKATAAKEFVLGFVASFGADRLLDQVTELAKKNKGRMISMLEFMKLVATVLAGGIDRNRDPAMDRDSASLSENPA